MIVLLEDECHLLWGDVCGYLWGKRGERIEAPLLNQRARQTCYGALNWSTHEFHLHPYHTGNSQHTVAYIKWLQQLYPGKRLLLLWDGATYHRDGAMKAFLAQVNEGLPEDEWRVTVCRFAPNAPEQNPVEDVWLAAKNFLRRNVAYTPTFAHVKAAFTGFLKDFSLQSAKFDWYDPNLQLI